MERWQQHFYDSLKSKDDTEIREEDVMCEGSELQIEHLTRNEVWEIIRTLKNNKSPGEDDIVQKCGDKNYGSKLLH
jgi:hypothetical protein